MDRRPLLALAGGGSADAGCVLTPYPYPRPERRRAARSYRYYTEEPAERRHSSTAIAKVFLFSIVMISFCVIMYIPVYSKVNKKLGTISGWSIDSNRDTRVYVHPGNTTLVHDAGNICSLPSLYSEPLFLLVVVCSSASNFQQRQLIRETWANHTNYMEILKAREAAKKKSSEEDSMHILEKLPFPNISDEDFGVAAMKKVRRNVIDFKEVLPHLAAALKNNVKGKENVETTEESRFEDTGDLKELPTFEMNKVFGDNNLEEVDYEEESNVMKIPPRGFEEPPDLRKVMNLLKKSDMFFIGGSNPKVSDSDNKLVSNKFSEKHLDAKEKFPKFKVVFLLGMPSGENETDVQNSIDEEANRFGDIIQEGFVDSYNNLTLKSIMMLKWIVTHCDEDVRYVLKTDDDVYVNLPRLVDTIERRATKHARSAARDKPEYYITGHEIHNARPVTDVRSKWYTPRYMYAGRTYPRYLSGTGYVMSGAAVSALYKAALTTPLFHLEDIFITGMCSLRATPPLRPHAGRGFMYVLPATSADPACDVHSRLTVHGASAEIMRLLTKSYVNPDILRRCERLETETTGLKRWLDKHSPKPDRSSHNSRLSMFGRVHTILNQQVT